MLTEAAFTSMSKSYKKFDLCTGTISFNSLNLSFKLTFRHLKEGTTAIEVYLVKRFCFYRLVKNLTKNDELFREISSRLRQKFSVLEFMIY